MKIECETIFMLISNLITKVSPSFWSTISVTMNCTLREKCPNSDQKKIRIWAVFTQLKMQKNRNPIKKVIKALFSVKTTPNIFCVFLALKLFSCSLVNFTDTRNDKKKLNNLCLLGRNNKFQKGQIIVDQSP